ncbi:thiamine pyrophosphate-binding protein [Paenibacillus sp. Root444D2]|uniref:thiamine pyrophosphate-binding protein n=1 Tax=Paenibacillus sp. Root444D2 TaxID=1736538 RepID=UPI00070DE799|nr:thiamine pyrophosphate-binding protein [Paenibacillus sp. Root444D2]KQX56584.1 pyruvate oxidase [Paenibacillus sp. Root444D2]
MTTKLSNSINESRSFLTVAEAILEQLQLWNVKRIYGVVGDSVFGLMSALAMQDTISFIAVKHESVAAMMASAEAKLTGRLGVCIAHMGPGLANLINGLGDAYLDNAPVLAITGQAPVNKIGTSYKQYINQQELVQAISQYSQIVVHPDSVIESLTQAMQTSILQRSVSHLSIPTDVFNMTTTIQPRRQPQVAFPFSDREIIQKALQLIQSAKQPIMLVGSGAISDREGIQKLAETWCCGVAMSYGAMGILPDAHPFMLNALGEGGNPFLKALFLQADVVLAVETSWFPDGFVPSNVRIVHISKHPSNIGTSVPVDIGLVGELANLIPQLIEGLKSHKPQSDWVIQVQQCKHSWMVQNEVERNQTGSPLPPSTIIKLMEQNIAEDAVIALDEGDSTLWFLRNFRANHQHVLLSNQWRTMGFGLPAAMAAKLCWPEKQVVCITGDGGLAMVLADLLTATRYGLPITVVVFNNGTLQMERDKMFMKGFQPEGTQLTHLDFATVAEASGWNAYRIETIEQLEEALKHSRTSSIPVLLDVFTAKIPHPDFKS